MEDIAEIHDKKVVISGVEPIGHYWINLGVYLKDQGMKSIHVNPRHVKKSKQLDDNNPNKSDSKDPKTIADLVNEEDFRIHISQQGYALIAEICQIFVFRHRKKSQGLKTVLPDGSALIFRR